MAEVRITEVTPRDRRMLADEDGDFSGWIELRNDGDAPVNLRGYGLSVRPSAPFQWMFGDLTIEPGQRTLVFASGKDRPGQPAASPAGPFDPTSVGHLIWWLDASDPAVFDAETGPVARWRDKSGANRPVFSPRDPVQVPGLIWHLDAQDQDSVVQEEDTVVLWKDRTGSRADAGAVQEAERPRLRRDPATGREFVHFDGADDLLRFALPSAVQFIIAVVREDPTASVQRRTFLGEDGASPLLRGVRATIYGDDPGNVGAASRVWLNGRRVRPTETPLPARLVVLSTELSSPLNLDRLGADASEAATFWQGDVAELLFFDRKLSAGERNGIEAFLRTKWGLVWPFEAGGAGDATQTVPWRRPVRTLDPVLGKPVVHFDGEDDFLETTRMTNIRTVFWVLHQTPGPGLDDGSLLGDTALLQFLRGEDGMLLSSKVSSGYLRDGPVRVNGEPVDPMTSRLSADWAVVEWRTTGPVQADALGTTLLRPGPNWAGEFAEVLVYDQPLSDAAMGEIRAGLSAKWGLPAALPHAGFRLDLDGGFLTLTAPGGKLEDWTAYPTLPPDRSWGRKETGDEGGQEAWAAFATPTPGRANREHGMSSVSLPPEIQPPDGRYTETLWVTMTPSGPDEAIYYTTDGSQPGPPTPEFHDVLWLDDALPNGATGTTDVNGGWEWVRGGSNGGFFAHRSPAAAGLRYHFFYGASPALMVREGDRLFTEVRLSPETPPEEIMIAWYDGSWEHRAYWGADVIRQGTPDTPGRFRAGDLPPLGEWVRLEVPIDVVGLREAQAITGMMFLVSGGEVVWDRSGRSTRHQGASRRYDSPLELDRTTVVRAVAAGPESLASSEVDRTYVLDFPTTLPVVSLAVDPPDLFSAEHGLLVKGTNASPIIPYYGANFQQDWEREGRLTILESDGRVLAHGGIGVKVQGGWSRSAPQKSLSLRARSRYGQGRLHWQAFPALPLGEFDCLVLRNAGNDWRHARMRDGLLQRLMRGSAVDVLEFRPAHVFLNGDYWGILNLRERTDAAYLVAHHPELSGEDAVDLIQDDVRVLAGDFTEFQRFADFLDSHTLENPEDYAVVTNWIDLDNYLDWICTELFVDNRDWPGHNVRCWRPRQPDGRWRWVLNDLDSAFSTSGEGIDRHTLELVAQPRALGPYGQRSTRLFRRLLNNPAGRRAFLSRFAVLLATRFSPGVVLARINELAARLEPEMTRHIQRWADSNEPGWPPLTSLAQWESEVEELRVVARQRPGSMRQQLVDYFGLSGIVPITLGAESGWRGRLRLGREDLDLGSGTLAIDWPAGVPLRLEAQAGVGSRFLGWRDYPATVPVLELEPTGPLELVARFGPDDKFDPTELVPPPYPLRTGDYVLARFDDDTPAGTYPTSMEFRQTLVKDPPLDADMSERWGLSYDLDSRSRFQGLGNWGVGLVNTGSARTDEGGGYVGELRLALQTSGMTKVTVSWTGGTVEPNERVYAIRLQWRPGDSGPWRDVLDATGRPVEYVRNSEAGHQQTFGPVELPTEVSHQLLVQLRWKYYSVSNGATGPRAFLRVDDIRVSGERQGAAGSVVSVRQDAGRLKALLDVPPGSSWTIEESNDLREWRATGRLQADLMGRLLFTEQALLDTTPRFFRFLPSVP